MKNRWNTWTSHPVLRVEDGKSHLIGKPLGDGSALLEAHDLSAGFLRIKRKALRDFQEHYPERRYQDKSSDSDHPERIYTEYFQSGRIGNELWGEDMMFSKLLREMGMPMFIYPNAHFGHYGVNGWNGNYHEFLTAEKDKQTHEQTPIEAIPMTRAA